MNANVMEELTTPRDWSGVLRITKSQLQTYLICPRKYYYQYVVGETPEFTPVNLVFGKAMHEVVASFYRHILVGNPKPSLQWLLDDWKMIWTIEICLDLTIQWDEKHTAESVYLQGQGMLTAFHESVAPRRIDAVEYPFAVPLTDPDTGELTDFTLVGVIDLIESDEDGTRIVSELKTAAARMSDSKADGLLDGLIYAYALDQLGVRTTETDTLVRIDVMVKTKTAGFQQVYVNKEAGDYRKLTRLIKEILTAIDAGSFFAVEGWACKGCPFKSACAEWMAS